MKLGKWLVFVLVFLIALDVFGIVKAVPEATRVIEGGILPIKVIYQDDEGNPKEGLLTAEASAGGFDEIELVFGGLKFTGEVVVNYIAPYSAGEYGITFKVDGESTGLTVKVYEEKITGTKVRIKVESFGGSAAYKKVDSEVWEPLTEGVELSEGDQLLTLKDSYVNLRFPNGSLTKVLENTQILIEKLEKTEDGYVVELKQLKGETYNVIEKLLKSGERFVIKTDSVTAGVRGTRFAVVYTEDTPEIAVFEGKVFAFMEDGRVVPVPAGYGIKAGAIKPEECKIGEEKYKEYEKKFEEKKKKEGVEEEKPGKEEQEKKEPEKKEGEKPETKGFEIGQPNVFMGPTNIGGENYLIYSLSFDFTIGPLWLDLGFTAYSDSLDGSLYYGLPAATPSTNLIDAFTINGVGLVFGKSYIKYAPMSLYDLGMSFTMRGYTVPNARALDLKYDNDNFYIYVHVPYELKKLSSFEFAPSDSLWFGEFGINVMGYDVYVGGIYDTEEATPANGELMINWSAIAGVKKEFLGGNIGVELSLQSASSTLAYGLFGGYHGRWGVLEFIGGLYSGMNGFHPFVFNRSYYSLKLSNETPGIYQDGRMMLGYLVGGELIWDYVKARVYLNGDLLSGTTAVEGSLRGIIPSVGGFNGLYITGELYDPTPFEGLYNVGGDTVSWVRLSYPLMGDNLTAGIMFMWNSETGEWDKYITVGADVWR